VVRAVTLEVTPEEAEILLKGKRAARSSSLYANPLDEGDARHAPAPAEERAAQSNPARALAGTGTPDHGHPPAPKSLREAGHD